MRNMKKWFMGMAAAAAAVMMMATSSSWAQSKEQTTTTTTSPPPPTEWIPTDNVKELILSPSPSANEQTAKTGAETGAEWIPSDNDKKLILPSSPSADKEFIPTPQFWPLYEEIIETPDPIQPGQDIGLSEKAKRNPNLFIYPPRKYLGVNNYRPILSLPTKGVPLPSVIPPPNDWATTTVGGSEDMKETIANWKKVAGDILSNNVTPLKILLDNLDKTFQKVETGKGAQTWAEVKALAKIAGIDLPGNDPADIERIQNIVTTLKTANPRFAQSEFLKTSENMPSPSLQPGANFDIVTRMKAQVLYTEVLQRDLAFAQEKYGNFDVNKFASKWMKMNDLNKFVDFVRSMTPPYKGMTQADYEKFYPKVTNEEQYKDLPDGTFYLNDDGKLKKKIYSNL
jgi:hypothetical protein